MTAHNPLADNLTRFRLARDFSQEQLAEAASVGVDTVARIEQGTRRTSRPATLQKLATALGVSVDALLGTMPAPHSRDVDIAPLRRAITADASIPGLDDSRGDTATEAAIFGPRVAALQNVELAARAGDPEQALRLAAAVPDTTGDVPAFWEAGHRLFLAAAAADLRHDRDALAWLTEARDLAPDWVRYQTLGKTTMRRLVDRATRRRGSEFAALASHYGVVD